MHEIASVTTSTADPTDWRHQSKAVVAWLAHRPWLLLPIIAIPAIWPLLSSGLTGSADGALHLLRLVVLDNHIRAGVPYPRWVPELVVGLGYPVFNFYGPSTYYLAELFYFLGLTAPTAMVAAFAVLVLLSGAGMYLLARDILGPGRAWAALLAATAYMYAPYLLTNVYIRGAIAEVGAQALLPWIFWSTRGLLKKGRPSRYLPPLALSLGALAVTHNITLLLVPVFLIGYVLVLWLEEGRPWRRLGLVATAIALAMAISMFFWAPLIVERIYLDDVAYQTSAQYLPENVWTLQNFLDLSLTFDHTFSVPFQLGLIQMLLALVGLIVARRWDREWLYWIGMTLVAGLGIAAWTLPIWINSTTLLVVQFPWRLLAVMSVPLALFIGASVSRIQATRWQALAGLALCGVFVFTNLPRVDWMTHYPSDVAIRLPAIAQFETETGGFGTSSAAEFRPRWIQGYRYEPASDMVKSDDFDVVLHRLGSHGLQATVGSAAGGSLRFMTAFFPGWQVILDDGQALEPYPSTNLGLLTVDVPAGEHDVRAIWAGTKLQRISQIVSLLALGLLALFILWRGQQRWMVVFPVILLFLGMIAFLKAPPLKAAETPREVATFDGISLAGYRTAVIDQRYVHIYPVWHVRHTPPEDMLFTWQLRDEAGKVVSKVTSHPYFNSIRANDWPPGTIVDDAYTLTLPPQLPAGSYEILLALQSSGGTEDLPFVSVGFLELETPSFSQIEPQNPLEVIFADEVMLAGYDLVDSDRDEVVPGTTVPVVEPGDLMNYVLYWQALQPLNTNYHSFMHVVDLDGTPLVKQDQLAGSFFNSPKVWDTLLPQPDRFIFSIPDDAKNGIYWPVIGLYEFKNMERLEVKDASGQILGDAYRLPPVKVVGSADMPSPQTPLDARFGDQATLVGYSLALPDAGLRPGSQFSVTLYYESAAPIEQDLTQFAQLHSPALGMAAQQDQPPLRGGNPTWSWMPGETIADTITLTISDDAMPGDYALLVGLYNPIDGARLPVWDASGNPIPDQSIVLTSLTVIQ